PWTAGRSVRVVSRSRDEWVFALHGAALSGVPGLVTAAPRGKVSVQLVDHTGARFAGLQSIAVHPGQPIAIGARVGTVGRDGLRYWREDCRNHRVVPSTLLHLPGGAVATSAP